MLNHLSLRSTLRFMAAFVAVPGALALTLTGCWSTPPPQSPKFNVDASAYTQGPPGSREGAAAASAEVTQFAEINIQPEKAVGYENVPEEMRHLYGSNPTEITLNHVVHETLANNRALRIQGYTLEMAKYGIPLSKGVYDLMFSASAEWNKRKQQNTFDPEIRSAAAGGGGGFFGLTEITLTRERQYQAALSQLLPTGASLQYVYDFTRQFSDPNNNRINPLYAHTMTMILTQPLLRGFGPKATNADIHIAQTDYSISAADFETQLQDQLQAALNGYWDLVFAVESYNVQVIAYTAALDLLRINKAKAQAGTMAPTEVLQAQASVEERREYVIRTRQLVRDTEDALKRLVFFSDGGTPAWNLELKPVQDLSWREITLNEGAVLTEAVGNRPEVRASLARIDRTDWDIVKAKDMLKPQLDVFGRAGINGLNGGTSEAYDDMETADYNNLAVGIEFSVPFQNRRARYFHRQMLTQRDANMEQYEQLVDSITFEVRQAVRQLRTARQRIDVSRARVESEQANLDAQRLRYREGIATQFQVLEFQENLAIAQESYVRGVVDYNKAVIALDRARGTLPATYGIDITSHDLNPEHKPVIFPVGMN